MPVTDFRQRTAVLFIAVVLGHIILISAQVNSSAGVPLLEVITFGAFIVTLIVVALPVALPRHEESFASTFGNAVSLSLVPAVYTRLQVWARVR